MKDQTPLIVVTRNGEQLFVQWPGPIKMAQLPVKLSGQVKMPISPGRGCVCAPGGGPKLAFTTDEKGQTSGLILRPKAGEDLHAKRTADLPSSKRGWSLAVVVIQRVQSTGADHEVSFDRGSGNVAIKLSVEGKIDALSIASRI